MNRRTLLRGIGGATLTALAGCASGNSPAEGDAKTSGKASPSGTSSGADGDGGGASTSSSSAQTGLKIGKKLPDFTLQTTAGTKVSLHPVEKPTVLFFMAAWCTSCKQEESNIKQVQSQYGDDVRFVSIDMDPDRDSMDDLRQFKSQYGGDWIHAMGTKELIQKYRLTSLDMTYITDQNGVTVYKDSNVTSAKTFKQQLGKIV